MCSNVRSISLRKMLYYSCTDAHLELKKKFRNPTISRRREDKSGPDALTFRPEAYTLSPWREALNMPKFAFELHFKMTISTNSNCKTPKILESFILSEYTKTHVQRSRNSKVSGALPRTPHPGRGTPLPGPSPCTAPITKILC